MDLYKTGNLAKSIAGRDKDEIYVIVKELPQYVYVADGLFRRLEKPKLKNKKHIQPIHADVPESELQDNRTIENVIRIYKREACECQNQT